MKAPIGETTKRILKSPGGAKMLMDALLGKREFTFQGDKYKIKSLGESLDTNDNSENAQKIERNAEK